jgi:hypothetical protein
LNPFDVAVQGSNVYWTESSGSRIGTVAIGQSNGTTLADGEADCQSIAADASGVYWARPDGGLVRAMRTDAAGATDLATGETHPFSLAADDSGVYWLTTDGKLRRKRVDQELPPVVLAAGFAATFTTGYVHAIALTSRYVVWLTSDGRVLRIGK